MFTRSRIRYSHWFIFFLLGLNLLLPVSMVGAQGQQRLGDMRVDWYCLQKGYGAWIVNNGADWVCTASNGIVVTTLNQPEFNTICQSFYGKPDAYAVRDRNSSVPALDWSCFVVIPPTLTPTPALQPSRLGEFQVEWYCTERGLGVIVTNNDADWACTKAGTKQTSFILSQQDFDQICKRTYNNPEAYALRDQNKPQPAYNWSCYVNLSIPPTQVFVPAITPTPQLIRLGEFQVEWYCTERGLGVSLINGDADWACTKPGTKQTSFVLGQQDFDQICKRTYNDQTAFALRDQNKPQPAYNWSCFTYKT